MSDENIDIVDQLYALLVRRGYAQHEAHAIAHGPYPTLAPSQQSHEWLRERGYPSSPPRKR